MLTRDGQVPEMVQNAAWLTTRYTGNPSAAINIQRSIWQLFDEAEPNLGLMSMWVLAASESFGMNHAGEIFVLTSIGARANHRTSTGVPNDRPNG